MNESTPNRNPNSLWIDASNVSRMMLKAWKPGFRVIPARAAREGIESICTIQFI